ncbi:M23 family metallopeptidase [Brevibacillus borstelensis]|uniref:M23 family metallopeptidase n=2 Tax=Brevibacillus TaxID=55080 RepID=UPI00148F6E72|nr:M23 family metallopeptidase [Brevibacillus borstelensis]NOU54567.1 M23 family metallopeptidase [Brevibacillus borstelensis]
MEKVKMTRKKSSFCYTPEQLPLAFLQGEYEQIYAQTSPAFRKRVSAAELRSLGEDFHRGVDRYKLQSTILLEHAKRYVWVDGSGEKGLAAAFDEEGTIISLVILHLETHPETDSMLTRTVFVPPFAGEWLTYWGGHNELVNYHYAYPNQRYAFDFLVMKEGRTFTGDPAANESYYAFGQPILAPAFGKVVGVASHIPDNTPVGTVNETQPAGNHVILEHEAGEYSLLAHLKQDSVCVEVGDCVQPGDLIGLCGNSGNSSEAHLHFQVSDSPVLLSGHSIPVRFQDGRRIVQGQLVSGPDRRSEIE